MKSTDCLPPALNLTRSARSDLYGVAAYRQWAQAALDRAEQRHSANGQDMLAGFTWDESARVYLVFVMGYTVATPRTLAAVMAFSAMHNRVF